MNTTRKTVNTARFVAALSALASFILVGMFYNLMVVVGTSPWILTVLSASAAVWLWDTHRNSDYDYIVRMSVLGAAYGIGTAGVAVLFG